jgi:hypothetical protein
MTYSTATLPARIAGKIRTRADECWEWTGAIRGGSCGGHGSVKWQGKTLNAHRVVYMILVGAIPDELPQLDHLCCNPTRCAGGPTCPHRRCVNPAHLEPVTHAENMRRAAGRLQARCKNGHPYDKENTRINPNGTRACRACNLASVVAYQARHGRVRAG